MEDKMKILIVNGSHRKGNTYRFVSNLLDLLTENGHTVDVLNLLEKRFDICDGCLICEDTGKCVIEDCFSNDIVPKLIEADAYVFAMPIYFNSVPALFKNFIDRTNSLCSYFEENTKKLAVFLVGQLEEDEGSFASVLRYLGEYSEIMGFERTEKDICVTAREPDEFLIDNDIKDIVKTWF